MSVSVGWGHLLLSMTTSQKCLSWLKKGFLNVVIAVSASCLIWYLGHMISSLRKVVASCGENMQYLEKLQPAYTNINKLWVMNSSNKGDSNIQQRGREMLWKWLSVLQFNEEYSLSSNLQWLQKFRHINLNFSFWPVKLLTLSQALLITVHHWALNGYQQWSETQYFTARGNRAILIASQKKLVHASSDHFTLIRLSLTM